MLDAVPLDRPRCMCFVMPYHIGDILVQIEEGTLLFCDGCNNAIAKLLLLDGVLVPLLHFFRSHGTYEIWSFDGEVIEVSPIWGINEVIKVNLATLLKIITEKSVLIRYHVL